MNAPPYNGDMKQFVDKHGGDPVHGLGTQGEISVKDLITNKLYRGSFDDVKHKILPDKYYIDSLQLQVPGGNLQQYEYEFKTYKDIDTYYQKEIHDLVNANADPIPDLIRDPKQDEHLKTF